MAGMLDPRMLLQAGLLGGAGAPGGLLPSQGPDDSIAYWKQAHPRAPTREKAGMHLKPELAEDMADQISNDPRFNTALTPEQEVAFQQWKQTTSPGDSGYDYDLRGAYEAGLTRSPDNGHFDDEFKKPNHPSFSQYSRYAKLMPELAGSWAGEQGDLYVPHGMKADDVEAAYQAAVEKFNRLNPPPRRR